MAKSSKYHGGGVVSGDSHDHDGVSTAQVDHGDLAGLTDDDHSQYHNDTRGDLRYAPIAKGVTNGDTHDHVGGDGAQIDHGGLAGLTDDDHTQYHNDTRGDARYALIAKGVTNGDSHDHDGGDGGQIDHTKLSNIGTNTHAQIDTALAARLLLNPRRGPVAWFDDFLSGTRTQPWSSAAIVSGTQAFVTDTGDHPGLIRYRSSASNNSGYAVYIGTGALLLTGSEYSELEFKYLTPANGVTYINFGFTDSIAVGDPNNGAWISTDSSGPTLSGKTRNGAGAVQTTASSYTLTTSTYYLATITVNSDATLVTFALYDMSSSLLWTDTLAAQIPTANAVGNSVVMWNSAPTTATNLTILDWLYMSINRTIAR